jgi:Uma2 family endonuclease
MTVSTTTTTAPVHRLSVDDVLAMVRFEILDENARVELVEGVLVDLSPVGPEHGDTMSLLTEHFAVAVAGRFRVRIQDMLRTTDGGYRLPDLTIIEPIDRHELPTTALLVIEIAQSSHARDHEKALDYARAGVPEYWIVDLVEEAITVHTEPTDGVYRSVVTYREGELTPRIAGVPPITLDTLFGR